MKISQLIHILQNELKTEGNLTVRIEVDEAEIPDFRDIDHVVFDEDEILICCSPKLGD